MFKVYFPFQWLFKGILLVLLGLILFGSYLTIKARYFPEEKPIKIVTKDLTELGRSRPSSIGG
ncbi:hypothetical protein [Enterococcus faecium]|uniref:hypothetical protein n=1 Tax=Enterococcus faecium TaxID=1352 RepID=UPI0007F38C09|nr:hypothetical protein [Enterococcus faecium]SAM51520.1 hypothetical protein DTPHA_302675 [Enterococcus faecium]